MDETTLLLLCQKWERTAEYAINLPRHPDDNDRSYEVYGRCAADLRQLVELLGDDPVNPAPVEQGMADAKAGRLANPLITPEH